MHIPRRTLLLPVLILALAAVAPAQTVLDVDQPGSHFTWTGTSSLGNIVGNPSNQFDLDGFLDLDLQPPGGPFTSGQFTGGFVFSVPQVLSGKIPNPLPFLPPLATFDIVDMALRADSAVFAVDPSTGAFSTIVTLTALHGTAIVRPLGGTPTVTPLAGTQSDPTPVNGTVTVSGTAIDILMPLNTTINFNDPSSGITATIFLNGTVHATGDTADPPAILRVGTLVAGSPANFDVTSALPNAPLWLAYSLAGQGSTYVSQLGVTLDLARPAQAGGMVTTDGAGDVSWSLPVPAGTAGTTVWFQAVQTGLTTNLWVTTIQ